MINVTRKRKCTNPSHDKTGWNSETKHLNKKIYIYRLTCASKFEISELSPSSGILTEVRVSHSGFSSVEFVLLFEGYLYINKVFDCGDTE